MTYRHAWYPSPIDLPEKTIGKFAVKHRIVKDKTPVIGDRQAFTRDISPLTAKLKEPLLIHELFEEENKLWMTDLPEELNQIEEMLYNVKPQGRVLVGGLGLGIVAKRLTEIIGVREVVVVEKSKEVIKLCANGAYKTLRSDILDYITSPAPVPYDYFLLDTWCGTGEAVWWDTVMPLRRAIRNRWGSKPIVHCWAEDIMLGQVKRSLVIDDMKKELLRQHIKETGKKLSLSDCRVWYYKYFPVDMTPQQAAWFLEHVGTEAWEKKYGAMIDRVTTKEGRK